MGGNALEHRKLVAGGGGGAGAPFCGAVALKGGDGGWMNGTASAKCVDSSGRHVGGTGGGGASQTKGGSGGNGGDFLVLAGKFGLAGNGNSQFGGGGGGGYYGKNISVEVLLVFQ